MSNKEIRTLDIKHYLLSFLFPSYQIFAPTTLGKQLWEMLPSFPLFPKAVGHSESSYSRQLTALLMLISYLKGILCWISAYLGDPGRDPGNYFLLLLLSPLLAPFTLRYKIMVLVRLLPYTLSFLLQRIFLSSLIHPLYFSIYPYIHDFFYCICLVTFFKILDP